MFAGICHYNKRIYALATGYRDTIPVSLPGRNINPLVQKGENSPGASGDYFTLNTNPIPYTFLMLIPGLC